MTIYKQQLMASLLLSQVLLAGCSQQNEHYNALPTAVIESSGLVCRPSQQFLTINDSGNPAIIWTLNAQGKIQAQTQSQQANKDWEALASDGKSLFVGDTGNNSGRRTGGEIYQYQLTDWPKTSFLRTISYQFADYPEQSPMPYQHDFDIEAMANRGTELLLFSKSWRGGPTKVYQVAIHTSERQVLKPIAQIDNLPGIVTDAVWSERHQVYLLTGYANFQQNLFSMLLSGNWSPFIVALDEKFKVKSVRRLPNVGQLEAICVDEHDDIWLSQEQYKQSPARLWRFGSVNSLFDSQ